MEEIKNILLGKQFPFFLNNSNLGSSYYLYETYSPCINSNLDPYVSLTKISECTKPEMPNGNDSDLIASCLGLRKISDLKCVDYLLEVLKKGNPTVALGEKNRNFPMLMIDENNTTENLIIALRHMNRWKNYRFFTGRKVDVLYSVDQFVIYEVCEDEKNIWLEPRNLYDNSDVTLSNPKELPENLPYMVKYSKTQMSKSISEIMHDIRVIEYKSMIGA